MNYLSYFNSSDTKIKAFPFYLIAFNTISLSYFKTSLKRSKLIQSYLTASLTISLSI